MVLKRKNEAPEFTLPSLAGEDKTLSAYRGKKVLLSFYRYASCPVCNLRVAQLRQKHGKLLHEGNLEMIAIFHSPMETLASNVGKQDLPFPLLSDKDEDVYRLYHVKSSFLSWLFFQLFCGFKIIYAALKGFCMGRCDGNWFTLPADFLIDEDGVIREAFYAKRIDEHMPMDLIKAFALQSQKENA